MTTSTVAVRPVETRRDLEAFLRLPWEIYRGDPHWVPPLLADVRFRLDASRHPFFEHARRELYLARRGAQIVGRIAAIVDDRHNEFHKERTGFFGMFECADDADAAAALFAAAERWCKDASMERLRGPMNLSMNDECGFLLEGFDSDPAVMMTYNPPYYLALAERCGLTKVKDLYAFIKDEVGVVDRIATLVERVKKKEGVVVRPLDMKRLPTEIAAIQEIYNSSWELNWGFVPMTANEMDLMAKQLKPLAVPALVLFAEVAGRPVGVSITLPDYNQVLKRLDGRLGPLGVLKWYYYKRRITGLRSLVFGLLPEYRRTGINTVLYYETEKAGAALGYKWCEMSWNLEDNDLINRFDAAVGGRLYKKYRICEKAIA